jgi:lipopolysaccharide/colanic/teichoic acid biosynthesis glycosyltransferase
MWNRFYILRLKRWIDLGVAGLGLLVLLPVIGMIAALIRCKIGSPIFFRQSRPGLNGQLFELIKFRTMENAWGIDGQLLPDQHRMSSFGRWLRGTSLDELPSLWNVVRGDMSIVGPRPLLPGYLLCYSPRQARRHLVKPGVTGLAQVSGRNAITWEKKFEHDNSYVKTISAWLDFKIMILTVWAVLSRRGISSNSHVTMPAFTGSKASEAVSDKAA